MKFYLSYSSNFTKKEGFPFGIALSSVEQCDDKAKVFREYQENLCLSLHCLTPESAIPNRNLSFSVKLLK